MLGSSAMLESCPDAAELIGQAARMENGPQVTARLAREFEAASSARRRQDNISELLSKLN